MRETMTTTAGMLAAATVHIAASAAHGQVPWATYEDDLSFSVCDVVNAANVELVVLDDTGELVIITGTDVILVDTFVDLGGDVYFAGDPVGPIDFATDGDGFRTLWWLTLGGTVVWVDTFTGEPFDSGLFPSQFLDVPCDACNQWDDPLICGGIVVDSDFDGIEDPFDFCPATPFGAEVDELGCACFEIDFDGDEVDDCEDLCPDTPFGADVDFDGCSCFDFDSDLDGVDDCIDECADTPLDEVADDLGCSCSQLIDCLCELDGDLDGVGDCDDLCPDTPISASVGADGCPIVVVEPPPIFITCAPTNFLTLMLTFASLVGLRAKPWRGGWTNLPHAV